ncbi:MAG: hypothetical protein AAGG51_04305 [Cyanobacteria bacterium P01_G01_bin.54]
MLTLSLPPDLAAPLQEEAQRQGTTPELLALDYLRQRFAPEPIVEASSSEDATLADFLAGYIGTVAGSSEAYSENCGQNFTDGLAEKQTRGHL